MVGLYTVGITKNNYVKTFKEHTNFIMFPGFNYENNPYYVTMDFTKIAISNFKNGNEIIIVPSHKDIYFYFEEIPAIIIKKKGKLELMFFGLKKYKGF